MFPKANNFNQTISERGNVLEKIKTIEGMKKRRQTQ